jgi:hypothetical protein
MTDTTIRLAYSKRKTGVTVFSYAAWPSDRYGIIKDNFNTVSHDTLDEAMAEMHKRIAYDWRQVVRDGRSIPEIIDCGKVADITGRTHSF